MTASLGTVGPYQIAVAGGVAGHRLTSFDLKVDGSDPVELRPYRQSGDRALSETWLFQAQPS